MGGGEFGKHIVSSHAYLFFIKLIPFLFEPNMVLFVLWFKMENTSLYKVVEMERDFAGLVITIISQIRENA